jgi:hypothetical protein
VIAGFKRRSTLFPGEQVVARTRTAICIAFRVGCVTTAPMQRSRQNPEIDNSAFSNALRQGALRIDPIDAVGMRVRACIHVLYCTVLYCTVLYCAILYCTVLCYTVLYCAILYCTVLCYTVLCYTVLYCTSQTHAPEAQTLLYPIGHLPGLRKSGTHQVRLPQPLFSLDTACRTLLLLLLPPDVLSDPRQRAGSRRRRTDHSDPN